VTKKGIVGQKPDPWGEFYREEKQKKKKAGEIRAKGVGADQGAKGEDRRKTGKRRGRGWHLAKQKGGVGGAMVIPKEGLLIPGRTKRIMGVNTSDEK